MQQVARHHFAFDLDSPQLAKRYGRASALLFRAGQKLVHQLSLGPGKRVLDVGCGTGMLSDYAARLVGRSGLVIGIDPLPLRIDIASRRGRPDLEFRLGTADDLSGFPSEFFDAAYLHAVLHWLPRPVDAFNQLSRVVKSGGLVGLSTVASEGENTFAALWGDILARPPFSAYPAARQVVSSRFSRDGIQRMLAQAGFEIRHIEVEPTVAEWEAAPEAISFAETISGGNLLGHLPSELHEPAREELTKALERLRGPLGIRLHGMRLLAVAERIPANSGTHSAPNIQH